MKCLSTEIAQGLFGFSVLVDIRLAHLEELHVLVILISICDLDDLMKGK